MDKLFKALDDSTRREILDYLKERDMTAGEIAEKFNISKPSISYHLDLLRQGELVISTKKGQFIYYSINTLVLDNTIRWFFSLIKSKMQQETKQ
jgi:DNA-binding transcriptional ArsR family regulator